LSTFVDTSIWYSAADSSDARNERAKKILSSEPSLMTSDHVLVEGWNLIFSRLGKGAAERFYRAVRSVDFQMTTQADVDRGRGLQAAFPDQDFSVADSTSFALMERLGIERAASFDNHFAVVRLGPHRNKALQILG